MRTLALVPICLLFASVLPAAETPRPSPDFVIQRYNAPPLPLSQFHGKLVALAFIHTTCSHCQELTRVLKVIQKDYAARNVQVVTCAFEEDVKTTFPMYLKAFEPNFPAGFSDDATVKKYIKWNDRTDGLLMVPYMIFVDAQGVIRGDFNGKDGFFVNGDKNIRAQLDRLLKPGAAKPATGKK